MGARTRFSSVLIPFKKNVARTEMQSGHFINHIRINSATLVLHFTLSGTSIYKTNLMMRS